MKLIVFLCKFLSLASSQGPGPGVDNTALIIGVVVAVVIATLLLLILVGLITVLVCKKYKRTSESYFMIRTL